MRLLRSALLATVLALALAATGCGSSNDVQEVPGPPPELSVPHQHGAPALGASATPTPSATASVTPTATSTPATTGSTGTSGTTGTNTAATTPAPATAPATGTTPSTGSPPGKFEQFCQQNAGAC